MRLHLVEPLGFSLEDRYLKRAGLDYWPLVDLVVHADWEAAEAALAATSPRALDDRLRAFSARGGRSVMQTEFRSDDVLLFGSESKGLPSELLARRPEQRVYIPVRPGVRSLNLANAVCLGVYTALDRSGAPLPDNDGAYEPHPQRADDIWPAAVARRASKATLPNGRSLGLIRSHDPRVFLAVGHRAQAAPGR